MSQDKPLSSDPEQRRNDTRASRYQSGLPPEEETRPSEGDDSGSAPKRTSNDGNDVNRDRAQGSEQS